MRRVVAGDVRDDERQHRRAARRGEPAALNGREVLAHGIDLLDGRAAAQQLRRHRLEIRHRDSLGGQRQQARAAARKERQQQVFFLQGFCSLKDLARGGFTCRVRHRMPGLDDADLPGRQAVPVAGDRDPLELALKVLLGGEGHRSRGLARGSHESAALRRRKEVRSKDAQGVRRGNRGAKALFQQRAHQVGANVSFAASGPRR